MDPYIRLPKVPVVQGRKGTVLSLCKGKRVLHLGCVDAGPFFRERLEKGELLHQNIAAVAQELWGVDIDSAGVSLLRDHGFSNLVTADACDVDRIEVLRSRRFDVIVAAEIIEHLPNPGLFLSAVKHFMTAEDTQLIITVPNAFRMVSWLWLLRGVEFVHPDHSYWFSYATATHLVQKSGFRIQQIYVYSFQPSELFVPVMRRLRRGGGHSTDPRGPEMPSRRNGSMTSLHKALRYLRSFPKRAFFSALYRINPFFADGIVIVARRAEENA